MRDRKRIIREVRAAFAGAERPEAPLVDPAMSDDAFRAEIEGDFAAHRELDPAFFRRQIFSAQHLTDDAFRWFVRSLLFEVLALDWAIYDRDPLDDSSERSLIHASVYWLRPNPIAVRENRTDYRDGIRTRLRLSGAQRVAVARVLHLVLESEAFVRPHMPHLASQAIAWCWRDDPAATDAAEQVRARARAYRRPAADAPEVEGLVRAIEAAFADTPRPASPLLTFLDEEGSDYELELAGSEWQTLDPWLISATSAAFCWMGHPAFRYFVPAALRAQLLGVAGNADPEYHLVNCINEASPRRARERISAFSPAERSAVVAWLRWRAGHASKPEPIRLALAAWESAAAR
jgi:hypothetical protein